jgi:hypothetical protein
MITSGVQGTNLRTVCASEFAFVDFLLAHTDRVMTFGSIWQLFDRDVLENLEKSGDEELFLFFVETFNLVHIPLVESQREVRLEVVAS